MRQLRINNLKFSYYLTYLELVLVEDLLCHEIHNFYCNRHIPIHELEPFYQM